MGQQMMEGPMPATGVGPGAPVPDPNASTMGNLMAGFKKFQDFSQILGDTPEERSDNAKRFAALVKDIGNVGKDLQESTLMERMMKAGTKPFATIPGGSASGGVTGMSEPRLSPAIMSQLGFK